MNRRFAVGNVVSSQRTKRFQKSQRAFSEVDFGGLVKQFRVFIAVGLRYSLATFQPVAWIAAPSSARQCFEGMLPNSVGYLCLDILLLHIVVLGLGRVLGSFGCKESSNTSRVSPKISLLTSSKKPNKNSFTGSSK